MLYIAEEGFSPVDVHRRRYARKCIPAHFPTRRPMWMSIGEDFNTSQNVAHSTMINDAMILHNPYVLNSD